MERSMPSQRDMRRCCTYGHDWRISFDSRFYYCFCCPAQWRGEAGQTPPQESSHAAANDSSYTTWADSLPERIDPTMPSKEFEVLLDADDNEQIRTQESWIKVRDMLYEPICVTRANIKEEEDNYNPGKTRTVAYVHFQFLDDEAQTPFVFSSSARAILNTVQRAVAGDEFPFDAAVIEILSAEPFNGYFPLRFTSLGKLAAAQAALEDANTLQSPAPAAPATSAPAAPAAPAAAAPSRASTAARAGNGSATPVTPVTPVTNRPSPPSRPGRNLATRGN